MANINKMKIGSIDPDHVMFDNFNIGKANSSITFGSIIPKDNSDSATKEVSRSVWQINDGWDIEIISPKKIAIKKFKIDTWGLRQIVDSPNTDSNYNNFKIGVEGVQYVHNNVVYHTAGSDIPDGFTKAYGGNVGFNVYWYPGQFDSGSSMQGLIVQFGCGYLASDNERDDSLQIGKHPWDVGTRVGITDGTITGTWTDGSYRAITIGLFGGVQSAASWHDESGDAYKVYDISDHPIYINLDVEDNTLPVDITSVECWDAYCGTTQVWHKDKTVQNCWVKHRLALPDGWSLYQAAFSTNTYIEWVTATKFRVKRVPNGSISVEVSEESNSNYANLSFQGFSIKMYNKPDSVTATFSREFSNITTSEGVTQALNNGETEVAAFSKTVYRQDSASPISYNQAKFTFSASSEVNTGFIVELVPIYSSNGVISLNTLRWSNIYPSLYIPETTDMESYMTKIKWNIKPANPDIWTRVKAWYESNTAPLLSEQFADSTGLTEITLNIPPNEWFLVASDMFRDSEVEEVTLNVPRSSRISSGNHFFRIMTLLTTINVNLIGESEQNWGAAFGCVDCSGWFEWNGSIETYPANLINWYSKDLNVRSETTGCTGMSYAFNSCTSLKSIPSFDYEATGFGEEANTIVPGRYAEYMLYNCSSLQTIGPILDMKLVNTRTGVLAGLNALTSARIKNLNHGDWDFTDSLKALDITSVQYLFANLADLTTSDPERHEDTIDKSFKNWVCYYFDSTSQSPNWDYNMDTIRSFIARKRYATSAEAPFVASTDSILDNMNVTIDGLGEGDSIVFGADGNVEPDYTFTEDGQYDISKSDNTFKGFKVLSSNVSSRNGISLLITNGLDYTNPEVNNAKLYCPEQWRDKITSLMIESANAKGWTIYIGGTEV